MQKLWVASAATAALVLASLTSSASAEEAVHTQGGYTKSEFVTAAMDVGHYSRARAEAAWSDPELIKYVPVEVVYDEVAGPVKVVTPSPSTSSAASETTAEGTTDAAATWRSDSRLNRVVHDNIFGTDLFRFYVKKYWEFNGRRVRNMAVTTTHDITVLGIAGQYNYNGIGQSDGGFRLWDGRAEGSHWSIRDGKFSALGANWTATIYQRSFGDGGHYVNKRLE